MKVEKVRPLDIIAAMVSTEGFAVPREVLVKAAVARVRDGTDIVISFGRVVFTVRRDARRKGMVHMYSSGAGTGLLQAIARFHRAVWRHVQHERLYALILDPTVAKIAKRFGWVEVEEIITGHRTFCLERPRRAK